MPVPIPVQWALFAKILKFDHNLAARTNDGLVVGLVYQQNSLGSRIVKDSAVEEASSLGEPGEYGVRCVEIDISDATDLGGVIVANGIDILYVTPLRAVDLQTICLPSRETQTMTLTGVPEYIESGLSVGIGIKGSKPEIIINLEASKAEGCHLSSRLLRLARVVR